MPAAFQYGNVEKRVARPVSEFNEPEALLRIKPLDMASITGPVGAASVREDGRNG
jgi:hypothetical protein